MRDLNREAWFLYTVTSQEWFEQAAQACYDFAETFNTLLTEHGLHGAARLDYWVQKYVDYAKRIRQCAELVRAGDDYMPMYDVCKVAPSDYRGMVEQPLGWMTENQKAEWERAFERVGTFCGFTAQALENARVAGGMWIDLKNRVSTAVDSEERRLLDRDDGFAGDLTDAIAMLQERAGLLWVDNFPKYSIDQTRVCRAGDTCPWTGVWIPEQGLESHSLTFAIEGRPMQPAYEVVEMKEDRNFEGLFYPITKARDTAWHPVVPSTQSTGDEAPRTRRNVRAGQLCPDTGWWFTPAKSDSRYHFNKSDVFPVIEASEYGATLWQWCPDQATPKL